MIHTYPTIDLNSYTPNKSQDETKKSLAARFWNFIADNEFRYNV